MLTVRALLESLLEGITWKYKYNHKYKYKYRTRKTLTQKLPIEFMIIAHQNMHVTGHNIKRVCGYRGVGGLVKGWIYHCMRKRKRIVPVNVHSRPFCSPESQWKITSFVAERHSLLLGANKTYSMKHPTSDNLKWKVYYEKSNTVYLKIKIFSTKYWIYNSQFPAIPLLLKCSD